MFFNYRRGRDLWIPGGEFAGKRPQVLLASVKVLVGYSWLVWPSLEPLLSNDKEGLGGFVANVANANQLETVLFF